MRVLHRSFETLTLLALLAAGEAFAHSGPEKPLFVAENGADRGGCLDPLAPCRTIGYALSVAGKGAEIRVAAGSYEVGDPEVLLHMVSRSVNVVGGFTRGDAFAKPGAGTTTLVGIPPRYRELLESRGFAVIADTKSLDTAEAARAGKLLTVYEHLKAGLPAAECVNGQAGELACDQVDLVAHVALGDVSANPAAGNDVWGFVDLNTGREYAIAGFDIGTAVFDVTDAANPIEVGFLDGQQTTWRDIKVYQRYDETAGRWHAWAYVTADLVTEGLLVIDLGGLPHEIARATFTSDFAAAHNVYLTNSDYSTGVALRDTPPLLVIAGSNLSNGAFRAYSLADPTAPALVATGSSVPGGENTIYTHDSSSVRIYDARRSVCAVPDNCEVLLDFNEDQFIIWDISDPANPVSLDVSKYPSASYVHSGWWSEDRQFFFVHDELDEQAFGLSTTLRVFSMADLMEPVQVGTWTGPTAAIDHNGFVRGNRYYMANYSRGLTILDITEPAVPQDVGLLDVYPFSDNPGFQGAWGAYPFFWSNTVAVNDIDSGLYLARDRTLDVPRGRLSFTTESVAGEEGGGARLVVQRTGDAQGAVSVGLEIVHATAGEGDYGVTMQLPEWPAGDATSRAIGLSFLADAEAEGLERLLVRLVAPQGGATLGEVNVANVYIADSAAAPAIGFFEPSIEIAERGFGTAVIVLQRRGNAAAAASVDYTVTAGSAVAGDDFDGSLSGTLTWPAGDGNPQSLVFDIADDALAESGETFTLALSNAAGAVIDGTATAEVTILDGRGPNAAPNAVTGAGQRVSAGSRVTLDGGQSNDPDGDALGFTWEQVGGPTVALENADTAAARFTAPSVSSDTLMQFELTVTDPDGLSDSAMASLTVIPANDDGGGSGSLGLWMLAALLTLGIARARKLALQERAVRAPTGQRGGGGRSSARGRDRWR